MFVGIVRTTQEASRTNFKTMLSNLSNFVENPAPKLPKYNNLGWAQQSGG